MGAPETIHVATKIPPQNKIWPAPDDARVEDVFPAEHVRRCARRSLRNLGLDTIDVLQFHVWNDAWAGQGDWRDAVEELRSEGSIRFFGVSINDHQPANSLRLSSPCGRHGQVIYNVFDQSPATSLPGVRSTTSADRPFAHREGGPHRDREARPRVRREYPRSHYFRGFSPRVHYAWRDRGVLHRRGEIAEPRCATC